MPFSRVSLRAAPAATSHFHGNRKCTCVAHRFYFLFSCYYHAPFRSNFPFRQTVCACAPSLLVVVVLAALTVVWRWWSGHESFFARTCASSPHFFFFFLCWGVLRLRTRQHPFCGNSAALVLQSCWSCCCSSILLPQTGDSPLPSLLFAGLPVLLASASLTCSWDCWDSHTHAQRQSECAVSRGRSIALSNSTCAFESSVWQL